MSRTEYRFLITVRNMGNLLEFALDYFSVLYYLLFLTYIIFWTTSIRKFLSRTDNHLCIVWSRVKLLYFVWILVLQTYFIRGFVICTCVVSGRRSRNAGLCFGIGIEHHREPQIQRLRSSRTGHAVPRLRDSWLRQYVSVFHLSRRSGFGCQSLGEIK